MSMKIKDQSRLTESGFRFWPPFWGAQKVKFGREHPNLRQESFCSTAVVKSVVELRDRCGVLIDVRHPEYPEERVSGVVIVSSKPLAANLLKTAQQAVGKSVEELGDTEVTDDLLPL